MNFEQSYSEILFKKNINRKLLDQIFINFKIILQNTINQSLIQNLMNQAGSVCIVA